MHILIIPSANFAPETSRGIFEYHQARALAEAGQKVGIISAGYYPWKSMLSAKTLKMVSMMANIPVYRKYTRPLIPQRYINRFGLYNQRKSYAHLLSSYISTHGKPDILHAHNSLFAGTEALTLSKALNIPLVVTEHDSSHARNLLNATTRKMSKNTLFKAQAVIAVSQMQKSYIQNLLGSDAHNINIIPNMIDPELVQALPKSFAKKNDGVVSLVSIGSLDANKNHALMLTGFANCIKTHNDLHLTIIGEGQERLKLEALCAKLEIVDKVTFTGHIDRPELRSRLAQSTIYIHTSHVETFGVSLIEALAYGKPVITTRCGGPSDYITPKNGVWIEGTNAKAVKTAIDTMLGNLDHYDPNVISQDIKAKFNSENVTSQLKSLYETI